PLEQGPPQLKRSEDDSSRAEPQGLEPRTTGRGNEWSTANLPTNSSESLKRPIHVWTPTLSDRSATEIAADGSCLHLSLGSWWPELPSSHLAITCQPRRALRLTPPPVRVREHLAALLRGRHLSTDN